MLSNKFIAAGSRSPTTRARFLLHGLCLARNTLAALALAISLWASTAVAQSSTEDAAPPTVSQKEASLSGQDLSPQASDTNAQPKASTANTTVIESPHETDDEGKQSKRILGIFPNYRAVSVGTQLPALSIRKKFCLPPHNNFDYS